jgi:UDP-N-acetylmuramate dehydrogenase
MHVEIPRPPAGAGRNGRPPCHRRPTSPARTADVRKGITTPVLTFAIHPSVPLAPRTTLGLGGAARFFVEVDTCADLVSALRWAAERDLPPFILGGGSNLVVGDEGFAGLVVHLTSSGQTWSPTSDGLAVEVQAGEAWDDVVAESVRRGVSGIECLSGIPGNAGAAPVQNIGAYGHEVAEVIDSVQVLDRRSLEVAEIDGRACGFGYRDSLFKRQPDGFVILSVRLGFRANAHPVLRYAELAAALAAESKPSPAKVRETVLALRQKKSMVFDPSDANHHSAGSFFTNPIVEATVAEQIVGRALAGGMVSAPEQVPRFPLSDGRVKLAAGWLIERAGINKGFRMGPVGISTRHTLALVHHGGGTTADLVRLALHVRKSVLDQFGIVLTPEPIFLGLAWPG